MPDIKFATADVSAMKLGTADVSKVMLGTIEVWPGVTPGTFPVIATTNTETGSSLGTANPIPAPAGVAAGDLLVAFATNDAAQTGPTASTGWTQIAHLASSTVFTAVVHGRIADGGANDALALSGAAQDYCASILRITGHGVTSIATDIKVATYTPGVAAGNPDPPSLDAGSSKKWLWLVGLAADTNALYTVTVPTNYTAAHADLQTGGTSSCALTVAQRNLETQTEDPGTFTAISRHHVVFTLAIPPAS